LVEILVMARTQAALRAGYGARDVINAPALRSAIERRSLERGDPHEVRAWLANHFYRHVVGNLQAPSPTVQVVTQREQAQALLRPAVVPPWALERLGGAPSRAGAGAQPLWWIDPEADAVLALESRLLEFLLSRHGTPLQGKLQRVTAPQALALWEREHAAYEAKAAAGWREHEPTAVATVRESGQGRFIEFRPDSPHLRAEMAYESQMMRHCLGQFGSRRSLVGGYGEHYATACEEGRLRLFSYRSASQVPHITISAHVRDGGRLAVDQIKGKQNRPPVERYQAEVLGLLNQLDTCDETPPDALQMGIVRTARGWCAVRDVVKEDDQLRLVQARPALVRELPTPTPLVQWLVAARDPDLLKGLPLAATVAAALSASGAAATESAP
jgi:hypothetical protein